MQSWKVRRVAPTRGDWATVAGSSPVDAAQTHHMRSGSSCYLRRHDRESEDFAVMEVEGFGQVISRCFFSGTGRAGAGSPGGAARDLDDVARRLGVSIRLLEGRWEGESPHWQPRFSH